MNPIDIALVAVIAAAVGKIVYVLIRNKKAGKSSCSCGCDCSSCGGCCAGKK